MEMPLFPVRCNPGGALQPHEVIGREAFAEGLWRAIAVQGVLLTAERRMGKTSLLKKLRAEERAGYVLVSRNVQSIGSADLFANRVVEDLRSALPGLVAGPGLRARAGVRKFVVGGVEVEFDELRKVPWQARLSATFAALAALDDTIVVFIWDELPHMIARIADEDSVGSARELLDILREARETHDFMRMIFSGSVGLHHVLKRLQPAGRAWMPTHDMRSLDLPALLEADAIALARSLLINEDVACDDVDAAARAIADQTDAVPYYIHLAVGALVDRQRSGTARGEATADVVVALVEECVSDPQDPWKLMHYVARIDAYYGADAEVVRAVLDAVAVGPPPSDFDDLRNRVAARVVPPSIDRLHLILELLAMDHYLSTTPDLEFRLDLLRRAWRRRRNLG
jgi:hypothetical protein